MSVLQYFAKVPRASTSSETGESSTDGQRTQTSDDGESQTASEDWAGPSPPKRPRTVSDSKLSASEVDSILTAEVPDLGLFSITKVRNSAATHDRL